MTNGRINDGVFIIKQGSLSQSIAEELGLNLQQQKQLGSVWLKIFKEVDRQQEQNIAEGRNSIYSGGNDLNGDCSQNYVVNENQFVEFSKDIWTNIINIVNNKLKTDITMDTDGYKKEDIKPISTLLNTSNIINYDDFIKAISIKPADIAQALIDEIWGDRTNLEGAIKRINSDNVIEVLEEYKKLSDEKNTKLGVLLDDETLIEAILDENISDDKKKEYINHIKDALIKKMESLGGDTSNLSTTFDKAVNKILKFPTGLQFSGALDKLVDTFTKTIQTLKDLDRANYEKQCQYIIDEAINDISKIVKDMGLDPSDIIGNGKFDKPCLQRTGNCWAFTGINAMMQTNAGKAYLNNLIKRNSATGSTSIYLPGAEAKGLPKPKGDGIYTYTDDEILSRLNDTALGDGDYTVLMLAIEDYRKEALNDPNETSDGGNVWAFAELIFGEKADIGDRIESKKDLINAFKNDSPFYISLRDEQMAIVLGKYYEGDKGRHAVAIKYIDEEKNVAVLIDSNTPNKHIEVNLDILLENSTIWPINIPS